MSRKRPYRLGKREATVAETKRRIIGAATAEYAEKGIEATSMQAVARRAEVAPGTVLYHYPTPESLVEACIQAWSEVMEMPTAAVIDRTAPLEGRLQALIGSLYGLYDRSEWAYQIYEKSPDHPALVSARGRYDQQLGEMVDAALGEVGSDPETIAVVGSLIDPGFRGMLLFSGLSQDRAVMVAAELALAWITQAH